MNANLLVDELFGVDLTGGAREHRSLPGLLTALGEGRVEALTGIQRHQADAVHIFLVYLAAIVLDRRDTLDPRQDETFWREGLRALPGGQADAAWTLVVEDSATPAFMQPPVGEALFAQYKPKATTPDDLDVLQTARNHDLKRARLGRDQLEAWAYALISLQTMGGYGGSGLYGIGRMNQGYGSRVCVETITSVQPAARWREAVTRLLALKPTLQRPSRPYTDDGHALLWTVPWDGQSGLGLDSLHPFFIEVCRLVRLAPQDGGLVALGKSTKAARLTVPKEVKGNLGDPWTPVRRRDQAALTVGEAGFTPGRLRDLIVSHEEFHPAPMQALPAGEGPAWFHASVLVRGEGRTDGYHETRVRIESKAKGLLLRGGDESDRLAALSDWALKRAHDINYRVLRPALLALMEGGPEKEPATHRREVSAWVGGWLASYDAAWSRLYFPWLWATVDQSDEGARDSWLRELQNHAKATLESALQTAPQRTGRRYRGKIRARDLFHNKFFKNYAEELIND